MSYVPSSQQQLQKLIDSGDYVDELSYFKEVDQIVKDFPYPNKELLPGVQWGHFDQFYTPAYWKLQYTVTPFSENSDTFRLGKDVIEEVVACLLGGYGLPAELGLQAFDRLKSKRLIEPGVQEGKIKEVLSQPYYTKNNRKVTYRFYNQKSKYIANFLNRADLDMAYTNDDIQLRNWLLDIKGIGPKTASWITRNWLKSEKVAIIDVHILRAGIIAGIFNANSDVNIEYFDLERRYLDFCHALDVLPSYMDSLMWINMRRTSRIALKVIKEFHSEEKISNVT
ncbi:8-oxoguanine DNA glycosylase [Larkinella sp. C7]|jgi:N-glycosylase/DNA lyase|uniref:8-oxoguanine DNA glycosylase n=1 Tax=Larkinella sp. C7 TaxID=2576607 RepID=UPI0011111EC3|nr:8-oxoguanine DNA glycosylase [Larkinella sp. C7]